jgi:hypothetical protein
MTIESELISMRRPQKKRANRDLGVSGNRSLMEASFVCGLALVSALGYRSEQVFRLQRNKKTRLGPNR